MASCGSVQSSDCLVTVNPSDTLVITIESVVYAQYGKAIRKVVTDTLEAKGINTLEVHIADKGAFDHVIKARLLCALERMGSK